MYRCEYCNRYLKKKYDKCPGCGGNKFNKIEGYEYKVIKEAPNGGYKIDFKNYNILKDYSKVPKWIIIIILLSEIAFCLFFLYIIFEMSEENLLFRNIFSLCIILMGISIAIELIKMMKPYRKKEKEIDKNINNIEKLKTKGILIKNLPYELKIVDKKQIGKKIYCIHVIFEIEKGHTLSLKSEPRYLGTLGRENGTVDVLIDPEDYKNYYIDFEIY